MKFLTTKGIAASIEDIIKNSKEYIYIISPYVKIDDSYIERLYEAEKNGIDISLIFGKEEMKGFEKDKFRNFNKLKIYFLENLHAKCYFNERTALITSMNLYDYSEKNNREMGIEINKSENSDIYEDIIKEAESIKSRAELDKIENLNSKKNNFHNTQYSITGYCIHCKTEIPFDREKPLCLNCFYGWRDCGSPICKEKYCHKCGKFIKESFNEQINFEYPLCNECYYGNVNEINF